jgi:endonuclease/exonuclease/phosphatase family metal-dependent hydrolase
LLVRTWNVFHGNADPPQERGYLEEAVRLVAADGPDVVCLQELPVWSLGRLGEWSGMNAFGAVAARPSFGPLPWTASLGRRITRFDQGLFRSAFTGQANAILVSRRHSTGDARTLQLNSRAFRRAQARLLGLDVVTRMAWAKERRVCQVVRVDGFVVANLHATGLPDDRIPDAEVALAAKFLERSARRGEVTVLAGDLNVWPARSRTLAELVAHGFSKPGPKLDQVLVRGAEASAPVVWPDERRRVGGRVLSDHTPVEVAIS